MSSDRDLDRIGRINVESGDTVGVVLEPEGGSDSFAVVLGGSMGGIPEPLARRIAACGTTTFALGYFGAPGLPSALVEIPLELPQRGIELFRDRWASGGPVGLIGVSKGAELALLLASQLADAIGPTIAISPSNVAWYGIDPRDLAQAVAAHGFTSVPASVTRSSWTWRDAPWPFLPLADGRTPVSPSREYELTFPMTWRVTTRRRSTRPRFRSSEHEARSFCSVATMTTSGPRPSWPASSPAEWRATGAQQT